MGSVTPADAPQRRLPPWAAAEGPFGVRLWDVGIVVLVIAAIEVNVKVGNGPGAVPLEESLATLTSDFLSQIVILVLAVVLGQLVRSRRDLAAETARRLRLAEEERAAEAGRVVAEERLRIARELHDTVAHSMATITVQAGSALHLLGSEAAASGGSAALSPGSSGRGAAALRGGRGADADKLRAALTAIRETSKGALIEMRSVLLRRAPAGRLECPWPGARRPWRRSGRRRTSPG